MYRIDHQTAVSTMPTPSEPGTQGFFTGGSPVGGVPATVVTADFMNMVQEELRAIVAAAGLTPSKTDNAQVLAAIQALFVLGDAFTGSNQSFGVSGYQKFPGGMIWQWGTAVATENNAPTVVNLPIAFPNAAMRSVCSANGLVSTAVSLGSNITSNSQITLWNSGTNAVQVSFFAIGR